jgi:hypothetical protein
MFGYGSGEAPYNGTTVSFQDDTIAFLYEPKEMSFYVSNTIMSDENGELLYYSNGCRIANKNHEIMTNGDSINIGGSDFLYNQGCDDDGLGYGAGHQSMLSIPYGGKYYLFHETLTLQSEPFSIHHKYLYYSVISFNDADGEVILKNKSILTQDTFLLGGQITAVKHANGKDWWIIKHDHENNNYYKILINESGVNVDHIQSIGAKNVKLGGTGGAAIFSPDGTRYAKFSPEDGLYLMDFDRSTGLLSNFKSIKMEKEGIFGSVAFSPSGRYLYINDRLYLYQFDMEAEDIAASKVLVAEFDGFVGNELNQGTTFGRMQLGPDCRIYINTGTTTPYLHIIENPNQRGISCEVKQHYIKLPSYVFKSMPHYPNYRLDTGYPVCDSSKTIVLTSSTSSITIENDTWKLYPSPATDIIYLEGLTKQSHMYIYDLQGKMIQQHISQLPYEHIDISSWSSGIYVAIIYDKKGIPQGQQRFVVE